MISYVKAEITITPQQLASARTCVRRELRATVWADGWDGLLDTFREVFYRTLSAMDIELEYEGLPEDHATARLIIRTQREESEMETLQATIWERRVTFGCPLRVLNPVIDELLDASFGFLGIKVLGAAQQQSGKVRRLRAA